MILSKNLMIVPMNMDCYEALLESDVQYFESLGLKVSMHWFNSNLSKIVGRYISMLNLGCDPDYLGWYIVENQSKTIVGDCGFKGMPDEGVVEIGYSILDEYQGLGYGKELVKSLVLWSYFQSKVTKVIARCDIKNIKSIKVLEHNGFKRVEKDAHIVCYDLTKPEISKHFCDYKMDSVILMSSCLLGINAKYNGEHNYNQEILNFAGEHIVVPICPEQLGGLSTPRDPAEIIKAGEDHTTLKVITNKGKDVTRAFESGADEVLKIQALSGAKIAILKESSPSCGSTTIYDGTFNHVKIEGQGFTCATILERNTHMLIYSELKNLIIK